MACLRDPVTIGTKDNAFFLPQNGCPIVPIVTPHLSKSQAPREHRAEKQDSADASTNISFP